MQEVTGSNPVSPTSGGFEPVTGKLCRTNSSEKRLNSTVWDSTAFPKANEEITAGGYRKIQSFDVKGNVISEIGHNPPQVELPGQVTSLDYLKPGWVLAGVLLGKGHGALALCCLDPKSPSAKIMHRFYEEQPLAISSPRGLEGARVVGRTDDSLLSVYSLELNYERLLSFGAAS